MQYCEARGRKCRKSMDNMEIRGCHIYTNSTPAGENGCLRGGLHSQLCVCGPEEWPSVVLAAPHPDHCFLPEETTTAPPEQDASNDVEEETNSTSIKDFAYGPRLGLWGTAAAVILTAPAC
mmetsp:Transcript_39486/g.109699  ORF Transcript_39486/g.109699 Transcript_39486/m.109699 type:complete len:121 (+) Transcript_39486:151-513(+)